MKCPSCGAETTAAHRFCTRCGGPLPQTCAACGALNELSAKFCGQCGMGLVREVQANVLATEDRRASNRPGRARNAAT